MTVELQIERTGDVDLVFEGDVLSSVSSWLSGKQRWTEIRIYRTDSGKYVTEMVGRSEKRSEPDLRTVVVHDTADTVRDALAREGDQGRYLTRMAREALANAGERDPAIAALTVERI